MTVFLLRGSSLRLNPPLEQNSEFVREGFGIRESWVSPTCFHSFRAGSGGKFEPEGSVKPDEEMCCVFPATCWLAVCLLGLVMGVFFFTWSCLFPTDFGGRIKDFNLKKKVTITTTKIGTEMLAKMHISSCFLYSGELLEGSNVNSHNVLISQVWEKLQVFGTCRNFALYLSVTRLFRAAFIFLSRHTHSFRTQ